MLNVSIRHIPCKCGNPCMYRCPKCTSSLCSLECSKKHKINCKDDTKSFDFIPLFQMDENTLIQDYRFLERISVTAESAARSSLSQIELTNPPKILLNACANRNIRLKTLPSFFKRSKENNTRVERDCIYWKILWTIKLKNENIEVNDCVNENIKINEALERALDKSFIKSENINKVCLSVAKINDFEGYEIEQFKCELDSTLNDILKGKCIIEHPCLTVFID